MEHFQTPDRNRNQFARVHDDKVEDTTAAQSGRFSSSFTSTSINNESESPPTPIMRRRSRRFHWRHRRRRRRLNRNNNFQTVFPIYRRRKNKDSNRSNHTSSSNHINLQPNPIPPLSVTTEYVLTNDRNVSQSSDDRSNLSEEQSEVGKSDDSGQRGRRQLGTQGGIIQAPLLSACKPGAKRDYNYKCRSKFIPQKKKHSSSTKFAAARLPKIKCPKGTKLDPRGKCQATTTIFG